MQVDRREWLQTTSKNMAACVLGYGTVASAAAAVAAESPPGQPQLSAAEFDIAQQPIIDTHQHLWDLQKFNPPWLKDAPEILRHRYDLAEYARETEGLPIRQAVYMEIDIDVERQQDEAEHVAALCVSGNEVTRAAVISGRPADPRFRDYVAGLQQFACIKGLRQVLHGEQTPAGYCLNPEFVAGIRHLGEVGWSFELCMRPDELPDGVELVRRCPETRFIVDHCGNADPAAFRSAAAGSSSKPSHDREGWQKAMAQFAEFDRVSCKISGIIARVSEPQFAVEWLAPIVNDCWTRFGADRVLFGSDWPVCRLGGTYRQWVDTLRTITADRSPSEQRRLWHDNAAKFYRLDS